MVTHASPCAPKAPTQPLREDAHNPTGGTRDCGERPSGGNGGGGGKRARDSPSDTLLRHEANAAGVSGLLTSEHAGWHAVASDSTGN